ncbi:MAG: N-acetylglucosamine-6-phosphate deacetylase [Candidatus Marinimicrobia bacterium]|nr:N-acetylglucosamine-6-phosphate deacetylase [Candidatus Neomarinimicrobiota bacterium]
MSTICLYNGTVFTGITMLEKSSVIIRDGKIEDVVSNDRLKDANLPPDTSMHYLNNSYIAPGFIDTHIHGIGGYDTADGKTESVLQMSKKLVEYGVTSFCPTLYPQNDDDFIKSIKAVVGAMGKEEGAIIHGLHLEGPFISPKKSGVQIPKFMKKPDLNLMKKYYEASENNISIMTVAPELKNIRELALYCTKKGTVLSAGHSNATYENMLEGMQVGILHSTHFFNAMRRLHHRDPGVVGAIMIHPNVSCEIIADGYHLHPAIIKLLRRVKPISKIVLITDSLKPTKQTNGKLLANNEEVYVEDGLFKRKSDDAIAGSSLTMIEGVKNLVEMQVPIDDALRMASCNPATVISKQTQTGYLLPGRDADVTVFDKNFNVNMTIVKGKIRKFFD